MPTPSLSRWQQCRKLRRTILTAKHHNADTFYLTLHYDQARFNMPPPALCRRGYTLGSMSSCCQLSTRMLRTKHVCFQTEFFPENSQDVRTIMKKCRNYKKTRSPYTTKLYQPYSWLQSSPVNYAPPALWRRGGGNHCTSNPKIKEILLRSNTMRFMRVRSSSRVRKPLLWSPNTSPNATHSSALPYT